MIDGKITGNWSIPGGKEFPGHLHVDDDKGEILLEIYGDVYPDNSEISINNRNIPRFFKHIWGSGGFMGRFTLYHCEWAGTSEIVEKFHRIQYRVKFLFRGLNLSGEKELYMRSGKFSFPYLGSFYDSWESMSLKVDGFDFSQIDKVHSQRLTVNEELELEYVTYISRHITEMNVSISVEKYEFLIFSYKDEVPFSRLLTDAVGFRKLLSFSYGEPTVHQIHSVEISHQQIDHQIDHYPKRDSSQFSVTNFSLNQNKKISRNISHQNHMLVSKWKMSKDELNAVIINWYKNVHLYNIYEYYLDSNNWFQGIKEAHLSIIMFNNRFLNFVQGLEDYYREYLESAKTQINRSHFDAQKKKVLNLIKNDAPLKTWLNNTFSPPQYATLEEKLSAIIKQCSPIIDQAFAPLNWNTFPASAKEFRNKLSHGMNKEINLGDRLRLDYKMAQLLLCVCILQSLDIQNLSTMISLNIKLQKMVHEILFLQRIF